MIDRDIDYTGCESWTDKAAREIGIRMRDGEHLKEDEIAAIQRKHYDESLANIREQAMTDRLELTLPEGVEGSLAMVAAKNPQAIVLKLPGTLDRFQHDQFRARWNELYRGTCLEGVPVIILDDVLQSVQIVDQVPPKPNIEFATPEDAAAYARDMFLCGKAYLQNGKRIDPMSITVSNGIASVGIRRPNRARPLSNEQLKEMAESGKVSYDFLWNDKREMVAQPQWIEKWNSRHPVAERHEKEPYIGLDGGVK